MANESIRQVHHTRMRKRTDWASIEFCVRAWCARIVGILSDADGNDLQRGAALVDRGGSDGGTLFVSWWSGGRRCRRQTGSVGCGTMLCGDIGVAV